MKRLLLTIDLIEESISLVEEDPNLSAIEVSTAIRFNVEFADVVSALRGVDPTRKSPQPRESCEQRERQIWIYWIFDHNLPWRYVVAAMVWSWKDSIFLPIIEDWKKARVAASDRDKERVDQFFNDLFDDMAHVAAHPIGIK